MTPQAADKQTGTKRHVLGRGPGRPKGSRDRRYIAGQAAAQAMEHRAWDVVAALLTCKSWRARLESAKVVLSYSLGLPRQTLQLTGGFGDLAGELAQALAEVRSRRALPGAVAVLEAEPTALEAPVIDAETVEVPPAAMSETSGPKVSSL